MFGAGGSVHAGYVVDVLRLLGGIVIVASLLVIVSYAVCCVGVALWSVVHRHPTGDPLVEELDRVLNDILGRSPTC